MASVSISGCPERVSGVLLPMDDHDNKPKAMTIAANNVVNVIALSTNSSVRALPSITPWSSAMLRVLMPRVSRYRFPSRLGRRTNNSGVSSRSWLASVRPRPVRLAMMTVGNAPWLWSTSQSARNRSWRPRKRKLNMHLHNCNFSGDTTTAPPRHRSAQWPRPRGPSAAGVILLASISSPESRQR